MSVIIFMNYVVTINSREIYMANRSITSINLIPPLGAGDEEEEKFFHLYLRRPRHSRKMFSLSMLMTLMIKGGGNYT
jgi:hypothetical protein